MKDQLKVETAKDGHKVVYHSKPLSRKKQADALHKSGKQVANSMKMSYDATRAKRHTNYWRRRGNVLNLPVALYLIIILITCLLIGGAIISIL